MQYMYNPILVWFQFSETGYILAAPSSLRSRDQNGTCKNWKWDPKEKRQKISRISRTSKVTCIGCWNMIRNYVKSAFDVFNLWSTQTSQFVHVWNYIQIQINTHKRHAYLPSKPVIMRVFWEPKAVMNWIHSGKWNWANDHSELKYLGKTPGEVTKNVRIANLSVVK